MNPLQELAQAAGLQIDWEDALGRPQRVSDPSLAKVLHALGLPAESEKQIAESRARLDEVETSCSFASADVDEPLVLPAGCGKPGPAELWFEDGSRRTVSLTDVPDGLQVPACDTPGYHDLILDRHRIRLAIAPKRGFTISDAAPGRRVWGSSVQIPALRDERDTSYGDFTSLAAAARAFATRGADALAISPVHALFPADPTRYSPYAPSSRLFLNVLLADPGLTGSSLSETAGGELIEWEQAIPRRLLALRRAWDGASEQVRRAVEAYRRECGEELERHATFDALHSHFFHSGARGWRDWPAKYHNPASEAVRAFSAEHSDEIAFYAFLQYLAKQGLEEAHLTAKNAGMAIGLIADLAVGTDAGGSHAWSRPEDLLDGLSIGAPPDLLGPDGQNWGITGFSPTALRRHGFTPFIATIRAALDHAGGIRIDHVLGLRRLWVVPHGAGASEGAYLTYPFDDMLRILAIESWRAKAVVIGEDLGTVPEGLRPKMAERGALGMRVLWFERDEDGAFIPPEKWSKDAAAMTGTHDLPTVAGWWRGRDIDWNWDLGRTTQAKSEREDRSIREGEREELWRAFTEAGTASGNPPPLDGTGDVADAAVAFIGSTPCELAIVPMEDVLAQVEQPNLPGTTHEHPNWRRRMPDTTEALLGQPEVSRRLARLSEARR